MALDELANTKSPAKQETAADDMARLQSKFQNLIAKVNQNADFRSTEGCMDDGQTTSIHRLE